MLEQNSFPTQGRYHVRQARTGDDIATARALRQRGFALAAPDADIFDETCLHMLVQDCQTGTVVCCFRLCVLRGPADIDRSYCAQFYDFGHLLSEVGPLVEMGRFCVEPGLRDADILRTAWGALTRLVDDVGARMLIGCSSFAGTDPEPYRGAFAELAARHLAPKSWNLMTTALRTIPYVQNHEQGHDEARAQVQMPPLLRSYLAMGGKVSDHAVIDQHMDTLHVFTGLEISAIPESRKRLLRALVR
ncbi:GNAT family N-acetyltransferase [Sedimentitalea todarodis]|uniref:L-ornithine N(alpha)-acyltransferase n=1 Tax=Sedimentitalea todarodis TaxID=1631240 RepID=A0ABU3VCB3_9RHOB|nr:GNAT family N-acyltransferase [Sedimentitalea todarodis]MDU9003806.1 GNAT family N-acyltransferase [Sedimentitalea todarodis]